MLDRAYALARQDARRARMGGGSDRSALADCAAAPSLFYADWVHPIGEAFHGVRAYRRRLLARPSFARAVDEARPYRHFFPAGRAGPRLMSGRQMSVNSPPPPCGEESEVGV